MKKGLGNLFITTSSSHFFNKTDFKQYLLTITKNTCIKNNCLVCRPEVESSRTHFEVLGSRTGQSRTLEDTFFELLNFVDRLKKFLEDVFYWRTPEKNFEDLFFFFFRTLALVSLVLGLEHSCPWPERVCLRKDCSWPWSFLCPWPWPLALCPRLHLWCRPRCILYE